MFRAPAHCSANCVSVLKVLDSLLEKSHSGYSPDWSLVETVSELQMGNYKYTNAAASKASRDLLMQLSSVLTGLLLGPSCLSSCTEVNITVASVL